METKNLSHFLTEKPKGFLITGLGASAGGIQALKVFFEHVPEDSGIAYVVILHLSPDHDSQLAEVLQAVTTIPVIQVTEKTKIEPNCIYVIPPNQHLSMEDSFLAPSPNIHVEERRAPVDIFFRTLADTQGPRAICVVLSGNGANGSMGLKRVKEMGGVAYAQNPREAEFNEMPRNAIATDLVDEVLPVAEIPARIMAYRNSLGTVAIAEEAERHPEQQQHALREIFTQLRVRTGHDFSNYKRPTLLRRIERRINVRNLPDLTTYAAYLHQHTDEGHALLRDLLISVTNFFRDKKPFLALEQEALPAIFGNKRSGDEVRIWVAGCATGEEAYSIAMLLAERLSGAIDAPKVQVFATDIDEIAINAAREGLYTLNDAADVAPERLSRFFTREGDAYRVKREIREMVLFAAHNVLKDPPFSRLDLVSCRNLLIYLNSTAQERVMETFHFALRPGGYLFLGNSESVDGASDLYATVSREHHLYKAREISVRNYPIPQSMPVFRPQEQPAAKLTNVESRTPTKATFGDLHQRLLEQYAPPSLIINEEYEIVHLSEKAGKFLQFSGGEPTQNLLKLIQPELRLELRSALYGAVQRQSATEARNLAWEQNGQQKLLNIHVKPVTKEGDTAKGFILVLFEEGEPGAADETVVITSNDPVARQLEEELTGVKAQLQNSAEQFDYQAEELKASNEELQAMNEELRSAAEELETSKEELQSMNEELRTVNQELKVKIEEMSSTSSNLQNLINSANVATIFLDRSFNIRLFTPAALQIFNLIPTDNGRPISHITNKLQYGHLMRDAEAVLEKLTVVEREVSTTNDRFYLMRLLPYRTAEDRINGVVVTFFDITQRKKAEEAALQSEQRLRLLIESAKDYAICTLDSDRKVTSWSSGAQQIFGFTEAEMVGKSGDIVFVPEDREKGLPEGEAGKAAKEGRAENIRWHLRKDGSWFWGSGITQPLRNEGGTIIGFVKILQDLTEKRRLEEAKFFLASVVETSNDSVITIDFNRNITSWNKAAERLYGYRAEEAIGKNLSLLTLPEDFTSILQKVDAVEHSREVVIFDTVRHKKNGHPIDLEIVMSPVLNAGGEVIGISTIARDVGERKRREANLSFLSQMNLDFAPRLSMHEVMESVGSHLADYLQLSRCHFTLVDEEADRVEIVYEYRRDERLPSIKGVHRTSDQFTEESSGHFGAGKLAVITAATDSSLVKIPAGMFREAGAGTLVAVPHLEGGRWRFLLTAERTEAGEWRRDELELLQELSSKIYIRIQRARAEEALRQSEAQYRTLFNSIDEGVTTLELLFDEQGKAVDWVYLEHNPSLHQQTGITGNIIGKRASELFPDLAGYWLETHERVVRTGKSERHEYYVPQINRWLDTYFARVGGEESRKIVCVFNDVSERKAEEERKEYLLKLSDGLRHLTDPLDIQRAACRILGEELQVSRVVYGDVVEEQKVIISTNYVNGVAPIIAILNPEEFGLDLIAMYKQNEKLIITDIHTDSRFTGVEMQNFASLEIVANASLGLLKSGNLVATFGVHQKTPREWTETEILLMEETAERTWAAVERAKAEEALRRSEEKYRTIFETIDEGFTIQELLLDEAGNVTDLIYSEVNEAYAKHTGIKNAQGKKASELFPHLEQHWLDQMIHVYKTGEPVRTEGFQSDMARWFTLQYSRVGGQGSRFIAAVFNDITERKSQEVKQAFLLRFSDMLRTEPAVDAVANRALQMLSEHLGLDRCYVGVYHLTEDRGEFPYQVGNDRVPPMPSGVRLSDFPDALRIASDRTLVINDVAKAEGLSGTDRQNLSALGLQALVAATLRSGDTNPLWSIVAVSASPRHWTESEIKLVEEATERTWVAIVRAKTEEALSQSEERLRILTDAVPQVIWTNTADGFADYFNQRWYDFSGLTFEASKGLGWQAIVHPDDAPVSVKKWKEAMDAGEIFETEYRLRRHDGSYCWFIGRNVPLRNEGGKIIGWFGSSTDIENLKKTEVALSQSEARLRITMESATDYAIITMDTERRVERWSKGATQLLGYTEEEMRGQLGDAIFTEEDQKAGVPNQEMETARNNDRAADERWHRRKDGSRFFVSGVMRPIHYNGELTGYVKVLRDMTQQQLFTEELHKLVSERTLELQRSNDDLQQFATIASHDLQEPLRKLRLFASVLQRYKGQLPNEGSELLEKISHTSDRMSQLIREVLQYSKLNSGVKEFMPTDLDAVLRSSLSDLELQWKETGASLTYTKPLPQIEAAPSQMAQLFYNLLTNSLKFRKEGVKPEVFLSAATVSPADLKKYPFLPEDKDYLQITFADNGIGFDDQFAEQIFQIFERLHSIDEYEGTGVGLALCKKIAENHGGHIFASAKEGEGARFHIILPVSQSALKE